jgi:hypothetical protein
MHVSFQASVRGQIWDRHIRPPTAQPVTFSRLEAS